MDIIKDYEKVFNILGREYRGSAKLVADRIDLLKGEKERLEKQKGCKADIENLKIRINALQIIHRTTREIGTEAKNYYKRGWWRSEKYTTNSKKSRLPVFYYGFIIEDEDEHKRKADSEAEEYSKEGYQKRIKSQTEEDIIDVLLREEESE